MLEDYVRNKIAYTVHPILFNIFKFFKKHRKEIGQMILTLLFLHLPNTFTEHVLLSQQ